MDKDYIISSSFDGENVKISSDLSTKIHAFKTEGNKMRVSSINQKYFAACCEKHPQKGVIQVWDLNDLQKPYLSLYGRIRIPHLYNDNILQYFENKVTYTESEAKLNSEAIKKPSVRKLKSYITILYNLSTNQEICRYELPLDCTESINAISNIDKSLLTCGFQNKCILVFNSKGAYKRISIDNLFGPVISGKFYWDQQLQQEYFCMIPWTKSLLMIKSD